jgi:hypothetical protein
MSQLHLDLLIAFNQMVQFILPPEYFIVTASHIVKLRTASLEGTMEH